MSSGVSGLTPLTLKREQILKAELGALLHNLGKLSQAFLCYQRSEAGRKSSRAVSPQDQIYKDFNYQAIAGLVAEFITTPGVLLTSHDWGRLETSASDWLETTTNELLPENLRSFLQQRDIELPAPLDDRPYGVGDFIEFQGYKWYRPQTSGRRIEVIFSGGSKATELLEIAHDAASGTEKENSVEGYGEQFDAPTYGATVFGYESSLDEAKMDVARQAIIKAVLGGNRNEIWRAAQNHFRTGIGDTRRTINDVSLWDLSSSVAGFFKAAVAKGILDGVWTPRNIFSWRLLRITFNGLSFLERAATVTDLLGRQKALQDALNRVKELLEVTYPLGNEVYRDENGSAFIVPALDGDDTRGSKLLGLVETLLLDAFRQSNLDGELVPELRVSEASKQAEKLNELLQEQPPPVAPFAEAVNCWWRNATTEICTACGLRPQGWGTPDDYYRQKATSRNVCYVCLERRGRRAQDWADGRVNDEKSADWKRTVWLDEVADRNGRLALLVGRFELKDWLNGEMVQTLLVKAAPDFTPKNPSFARLRRVWETTKRFWEEVRDKDIPLAVGADRRRLVITPENQNELARKLGRYHVYEAELGELRTSLVWDAERRVLLTADDLSQVASKLGLPKRRADDPVKAAEYVKTKLVNCTLNLYEPGGYGQRREQRVEARLGANAAQLADEAYAPMIPLLTEPATFMALVPADRALEAVKKISTRFKREMGKVRNRLPFFLGTVFFDRRQPLFTALDAGRRMIGLALPEEQLTISTAPTTRGNDCELAFSNGLKWPIPVKMGDVTVTVADEWYPYFHVNPDASGNPPTGRTHQFECGGKHWVHAESLAQNDQISVYPARFAYLHLDTSARRFQTGQVKLWWLEEGEAMIELWDEFKRKAQTRQQHVTQKRPLTDTQLRAVETLFKTKWEQWRLNQKPREEATEAEKNNYQQRLQAFGDLVETTLKQAGLNNVSKGQVLSGLFAAALELYLHIIKDRLAPDQQPPEPAEETQL